MRLLLPAILAASLAGVQAGQAAEELHPSPAAPARYERVSLRELGAVPKRFYGRAIEVPRVKCLRGGPGEYRCVPAGASDVTFLLREIEPAGARTALDRDCRELGQTLRRAACTLTLRLVPRSALNLEVRRVERTIISAPVGIVSPAGRS